MDSGGAVRELLGKLVVWLPNTRGEGVLAGVEGKIAFPSRPGHVAPNGRGLVRGEADLPSPGQGEFCNSYLNPTGTTYFCFRSKPQELITVPGVTAPIKLRWENDGRGQLVSAVFLDLPDGSRVRVEVRLGRDQFLSTTPYAGVARLWSGSIPMSDEETLCWLHYQTWADGLKAYAYLDKGSGSATGSDVAVEQLGRVLGIEDHLFFPGHEVSIKACREGTKLVITIE